MKVTHNIGILNALIRITIGLTLLSWTTAKMVKRPWRDSYLFVAICAAMKVAEGIVRFCPVTALFQEGQGAEILEKGKEMVGKMDMFQNGHESHDSAFSDVSEGVDIGDSDQVLPYNPT